MKDKPLECKVENDQLIISIGVDTLAFADTERTGLKILNPLEYAKDVANSMADEDDIGATPLTRFIDKMMQSAVDNGSMWVEEGS